MGDVVIISYFISLLSIFSATFIVIDDFFLKEIYSIKNNKDICKDVYSFYLQNYYKTLPFSNNKFYKKTKLGLENLEILRSEELSVLKENFWIKNNLRTHNSIILNQNLMHFQEIKYLFADYIFNDIIYKKNWFIFNKNGKINYNLIINRNCLPYYTNIDYLKQTMFCKNSNINIYKFIHTKRWWQCL